MFLNRLMNSKKILKLQILQRRGLSVSTLKISKRFNGSFATLVGLGCSLTILSTLGLAYGQSQNHETESDKEEEGSKLEEMPLERKKTSCLKKMKDFEKSVQKSTLQLEQVKEEFGSPGLVCAISIDGDVIWTTGIGFADVENGVKCNVDTKMRIASISKALTSIAIAKLMEEGKLDLDAPIQKYVKYFPKKEFDNEPVTITTRQLMSHTSGIRHYDKSLPVEEEKKKEDEKEKKEDCSKKQSKQEEFEKQEYYIKDHFKTTEDAIKLFQNDPLLKRPGTDYLYSTHAWTLLSGVIEGITGTDYVSYMKQLCYDLGLENTLAEFNDPLTYNRSRNYTRNEKGRLQNSPYVDNSYKFAGGGFMSTAEDLIKIGNIMLFCYQNDGKQSKKKGYLSKKNVDELWTVASATNGKVSKKFKDMGYGLGWMIQPELQDHGCCRSSKFSAMHSGGAVGASSVLLIIPRTQQSSEETSRHYHPSEPSPERNPDRNATHAKPRGIVVAIIVNMQAVGLIKTAFEIAKNFDE